MYRLSLIISEIYNKYLPLAEKEGIILNLDFSDTTKEIADPERVKTYLDDHLHQTLKRTDPTKKGEVTIGVNHESITITDTATTLSHTACALLSNRFIDVKSRLGFGTTVTIFLKPREVTPPPKEKPPVKISGLGVAANLDNNTARPTLTTSAHVSAQQGRKDLNLSADLQLTGKSSGKTPTSTASSKSASPKKSREPLLSSKSKSKTAAKSTSSSSAKPKKTLLKKSQSPKSTTKSKVKLSKTDRQLAIAARKADKEVKRIAKKVSKQTKLAQKSLSKAKITKSKRKPTKKLEIS